MGCLKYLDVWEAAYASQCPFCFFIGGRGTGKTYSVLKGHHEAFEDAGRLLYTRLTAAEMDGCTTPAENPYKDVNSDCGWNVELLPTKGRTYIIADVERDEDGKIVEKREIGIARSIAGFSNVRGVSYRDVTTIFFDEFLPTGKIRRTPEIKQAGQLFLHLYETVNRNRELQGKPPVKVIFCANSFSLESSILNVFSLQKTLSEMRRTGQTRVTIPERGIYIDLCADQNISEHKASTALYRATSDSRFKDLALANQFTDTWIPLIKKKDPLNEYTPHVRYDNIIIYRHKSNGMWRAVTQTSACNVGSEVYTVDTVDQFKAGYRGLLKHLVISRLITFDDARTYYRLCVEALDI